MQKFLINLQEKLSFRQKPLTLAQVIGIAGIVIFFMMISAVIANENRPWAVRIGDRVVAVVADKSAAQAALDEAIRERAEICGQPVSIAGRVTFERAGRSDGPVLDIETFRSIIASEVELHTRAAALFIDGEKKLVVRDEQTAQRLLAALKEQYARNLSEQAVFAEDVQIKTVNAGLNEILTFEEALAFIKKGAREAQTYTVKEGDTLWDIAALANVDIKTLLAINPGLPPECLQIGQVINLSECSPLLNVIVTSKITAQEEIPFPVEEREDSSLYKGQYRVVQKGKPGKKEVTYEVTYQNGIEKGRLVLEEEILSEPTPQIVAKGSRLLLASRSGASGRLGWPAAGPVVSPFGYRGRDFHAGIDIAAGTGAPVAAAESGRVVRAGWYGGYGKCVDISHGSGVITRYAHLSSVAVRVGEQVARGQLIGRVGATGNATGPHLHFEVIVNGQPLNPVNFL